MAWTSNEDNLLRSAICRHGARRWDFIAAAVPTHSEDSCCARWDELQNRRTSAARQPWAVNEDGLLRSVVGFHGPSQWTIVASFLPGRTAKQCRERWRYRLDPSIKRGAWSADEDALLVTLQRKRWNAWFRIAAHLPGRTDNAIKNRWHSARVRHRKREKSEPTEILAGNANLPTHTALGATPSFASDGAEDFALWADLAACLLDDLPAESHGRRAI
ncbi:hypothetical protein KRP22_006077 [Phytophthora ramorum]|nr:Transcription factor MYB3R-5 [Phytophthora ramorum]